MLKFGPLQSYCSVEPPSSLVLCFFAPVWSGGAERVCANFTEDPRETAKFTETGLINAPADFVLG